VIGTHEGDGTFFLYEDPSGNTLGRGTELVLELKKDADEYLDTD
jgi:heat shock protein beta